MALETSGTLSIGGTTTNRSINLELGRSATATSSLGETDLRDLAGVASGAIGIDDFYGASSVYNVENSIKVQANSGNEWFYRSGPTAGNRRTFTFSFWLKRTQLTGFQADPYLMSQGTNARFHFAGDTLRFMFDGSSTEMEAAGKLTDCTAWYHIVLAIDTTQATNTNRVKMYVNGEDYPFNNNDWPSQNQESSWMSGTNMYFNTRDGDGSYDNSGYWAEVAVIDGSALTPTSFGEYDDSGTWKPKDLSGLSFGNQGFYLKFDNAASLGADSSGNGKNVTLNNITSVDQATDTPTNNFCTLNPLFPLGTNVGNLDITEGATRASNSVSSYKFATSTVGVTSGKWYWEVKATYVRTISTVGTTQPIYWDQGNIAFSGTIYYAQSGQRYNNSSASSFGAAWGDGDIIAFALDMDASTPTLTVYKNNTSIGNLYSGLSLTGSGATYLPPVDDGYFAKLIGYSTNTFDINFGGYTVATPSSAATDANGYGTFEYAPPSGYYAICTKNLAEYGG